MPSKRLPAEWETQDGVLLAWPHAASNWRLYLEAAQATTAAIIAHISLCERVIVVALEPLEAVAALQRAGARMDRVACVAVPTNDIWARDFGPITVLDNGQPALLDFMFNGWGRKYPADLDNLITRRLHAAGVFGSAPLRSIDIVLEGGSVETDGRGTILTTRSCLMHPNRNGQLGPGGMESQLAQLLNAQRVLWLTHGYLAGDDTDGHIDMLARFAPDDTILHLACHDVHDEHYAAMAAMTAELQALRTMDQQPYRLMALPWPSPKFDPEGQRLPASYANFLVINGAVLVPTYRDKQDSAALEVVGCAFPGRHIIGVDCSTLIRQHGALHCVTMQLPRGVLA